MIKFPPMISYDALLKELACRLLAGKQPEDSDYFADLIFNLDANRCSLERRIFEQQNGLTKPNFCPHKRYAK